MQSIKLKKSLNPGGYIISSFQTVGYISILATKYLEEKHIIKDAGFLELDIGTPIAVIENGEVGFPIRVYQANNSILISSQFPLSQSSIKNVISAIVDLYKKYKYKGIICLDGLSIEQGKENSDIYYTATKNGFQPTGGKKLESGAIIGLNAELMLRAQVEGIPATILMAETHSDIPDGIAAASLISALAPIGIKVDTTELVSQYKKTLEKINQMLKRVPQKEAPKNQELYG
jgi:predicted ATP-grasp superfamily ATP-dependent carboligase